jgi:hypothetical protein
MITPLNYGFLGRTSSAYYWAGAAGNASKFPNLVIGGVEAAFMSGLFGVGATQLAGSNMPGRDVIRYTRPSSVLRYGATPSTLFAVFVGLFGKNRVVFPFGSGLTNTWQVFGNPANAT